MTSTRLSRGTAAAVLVAGLALGGCATQPGTAAVVDGERITENELARAVADFSAVTGQPVDSPQMLATLVVAPSILGVAADHGVAATESEAAALLDQQAQLAGAGPLEDGYGSGVLQVAQMTIVSQDLATTAGGAAANEEIFARVAESDIEVSPRYGDFDPAGQIVPQSLPWITTSQ